jgi:hypothetical protein
MVLIVHINRWDVSKIWADNDSQVEILFLSTLKKWAMTRSSSKNRRILSKTLAAKESSQSNNITCLVWHPKKSTHIIHNFGMQVGAWHRRPPASPRTSTFALIKETHASKLVLWHLRHHCRWPFDITKHDELRIHWRINQSLLHSLTGRREQRSWAAMLTETSVERCNRRRMAIQSRRSK